MSSPELPPEKAAKTIDAASDLKRHDLFTFIKIVMRSAAMVPLGIDAYLPKCLHWFATLLELLYELFLYVVPIHIWILFVCTLYQQVKEGNLEFIVNCLIQTIIYFWTIAMKFYFRRVQPQVLQGLIDAINAGYRIRSARGFTYVTMNECLAYSNKCCKIYVYCCFLGTVFWLILPISYGGRTLPLTCWYPFDYKQPLIYEAMYFLQSVGQLEVAAAFSASSALHMVFAILISGQYDVLFCSLKNLYAGAYLSLGAPRDVLRYMQDVQRNADAELGQYYCSKEHSLELSLLPLASTRLDWTTIDGEQPEKTEEAIVGVLKRSFGSCVLHHHHIVDSLRQMEIFYSPIWLVKTGEVIFLMCLVAFVSVKSTTANSSFLKIISLGQYLVLVAWEMLIICYFGEMITQNSRRCGDALLRSPWYLNMRAMRQDFTFFLMNSQRAFRLTGGKIFILNVERFRSIIQTAFSFLTLLQKMDNRSGERM